MKEKYNFRYEEELCEGKSCLYKKICDNGALGEDFVGYSIGNKFNKFDFNIPEHELIDTFFWKKDTLFVLFDDFQYLGSFRDTSYAVKKGRNNWFIKQLNLSSISTSLNIIDSMKYTNSLYLYKYYYCDTIKKKKNIQFSIGKVGDPLPLKGNIIRANNSFFLTFLKSIKIHSEKIMLEYDSRGRNFLFYTNDKFVSRVEI